MNIVLDILRYIKENKIPMIKIAEAAGMAPQNIKKSITNNPKADTILNIANGLGVHPSVFFYDMDEESSTASSEAQSPDIASQHEAASLSTSPSSPQGMGDIESSPVLSTTATIVPPADSALAPVIAFCPHCGKRVRIGVMLLSE